MEWFTAQVALLIGTVVGGVFTFVIGLLVFLFGSKGDRDNSVHKAAQEWRVLYEATKKENEELKAEIATLEQRMEQLMKRVGDLESNRGIHLFTDKLK